MTFEFGWPWTVAVRGQQNYTWHISKMVTDTIMGSIEVELEIILGLSIGTMTFDLRWPWTILDLGHRTFASDISNAVRDTMQWRSDRKPSMGFWLASWPMVCLVLFTSKTFLLCLVMAIVFCGIYLFSVSVNEHAHNRVQSTRCDRTSSDNQRWDAMQTCCVDNRGQTCECCRRWSTVVRPILQGN